ncbi:MAG: mandelate racemase/muconate lactonizing enzyme family protein [Candidatus Limnocylindrales bacterium]
MTLVRAGAVRVRIPFRAPFATAAGMWVARDAWILRLRDADGREGVGEANLDPAADEAALDRLAAAVRHWASGGSIDPDDAAGRAVDGAVEAAQLDLGGRAAATSVAVNATIATEDSPAAIGAARDAVARGFTTLKLKGGRERSTAELVERLTAVRSAIGPDVALRLDVNGSWDPAIARERLAALASLGLEYVEQPIPAGDVGALTNLRAGSPVPIATDESVKSIAAARALLDAGAADVLVVKPGRVGGPLVALAIAREAAAAGVRVTISTLLDTGVGLTAALRVAVLVPGGVHGLATADVLESDLLAAPLVVRDGRIVVPTGPGTALDEEAIERYTTERIGGDR